MKAPFHPSKNMMIKPTVLLSSLLISLGIAQEPTTEQEPASEPKMEAPTTSEAEAEAPPEQKPDTMMEGDTPPAAAPKMDNERISAIIAGFDPDVEGEDGLWKFTVGGESVLCVTSEDADRMRILSAAAPLEDVTAVQLVSCMQANYHSALDGRYCIGEETVWAAFLHPLGELSDELFLSAIAQVVSLKKTFGTTYTGGTFQFGGPGITPEEEAEEEPKGPII